MSIELGTAYVSISARTDGMAKEIQSALNGAGKAADKAGTDMGSRLASSASKAMKDGWRPDQDIMSGIPDTRLDRVGARIGQVIGKGVAGGLKANEAGQKFATGFNDGASSIGIGKLLARWKTELSGGNALHAMGAAAGKTFAAGLTGGALLGSAALIGGIGAILTKGFDRLLTIDKAKFKLKGLGKSTGEIADIVKTVTDSVTGTPFALDQAFATAVQAIGAGTEDLKRFMTDVADAAGFAGTDIDRMGLIFNQIQAKGKLTGEEMMQLMESGLPAKSWIEDSYKLTSDQFDKMQADGEITMDMLEQSIEDHAGGMSKKLGESLQGSIDQLKTSVARVGADFLTAIFGGDSSTATDTMAQNIQKVTNKLDEFDNWIKTHGPQIQNAFKDIGQGIKTGFDIGRNSIKGLMDDIHLLATGLGNIFGAMASFDESLAKIPLIGSSLAGDGSEAKTLRQWQQNLAQWGGPQNLPNTPAGPGGLAKSNYPFASGGGNGPHGEPGSPRNPILGGGGIPLPGSGGAPTVGGIPIPGLQMPGGGGQGWMNGAQASQYLDQVTGKPVDALTAFAQTAAHGQKYSYGGVGIDGMFDCSGIASALYAKALGLPGGKRYFTTDSDFAALGFQPGYQPGALNIGTNGGSGENGHMAATLPNGVNVESSSSKGTNYGGPAIGAGSFSQQWHLPLGMAAGGAVWGAGSGTSDSIPALLSNGEHVLTAKDVSALGGQRGVYALREAIHLADGGAVGQKLLDDMRTKGYIPAAAGSSAKAGESAIAGAIDLGGEAINAVIDQAASIASQAASSAAAAGLAGGTMGAGAAGAPAAGAAAGAATDFAIGLGTDAAKRGVTYGFDELGILADSLLMQATPFGQPQWLNTDPKGFMPNFDIGGALGELMTAGTQQAMGPVDPNTTQHGTSVGAPPGPELFANQADSFLSTQPLNTDAPMPDGQQPMVKMENVYTSNNEELARETVKRQNLAAMQYTGRPTGR